MQHCGIIRITYLMHSRIEIICSVKFCCCFLINLSFSPPPKKRGYFSLMFMIETGKNIHCYIYNVVIFSNFCNIPVQLHWGVYLEFCIHIYNLCFCEFKVTCFHRKLKVTNYSRSNILLLTQSQVCDLITQPWHKILAYFMIWYYIEIKSITIIHFGKHCIYNT